MNNRNTHLIICVFFPQVKHSDEDSVIYLPPLPPALLPD